jgi:hypothetical protein
MDVHIYPPSLVMTKIADPMLALIVLTTSILSTSITATVLLLSLHTKKITTELFVRSQTLLSGLKQERGVFYDFIHGNVNDRHGYQIFC